MFVTLHCGGMPFNGETAETQSLGGSESAAYYLARELSDRGHRVTLFTSHQEGGTWDGVRYEWMGEQTERHPFGERFHLYAENTPADVLVMQRHPEAFRYRWAAKLNLWWLHDLALGRNTQQVHRQLWNVDGILAVSRWHADQVNEVHGLSGSNTFVVPNGVAPELGDLDPLPQTLTDGPGPHLYYGSRPERGLEHLVREGGIMERLAETRPDARLYVSMYDNVAPHMEGYYRHLFERCEALPNVVHLGVLTRPELVTFLRDQVDLVVYPSEFEETSCLLAKEAMLAGTPLLGSRVGALPETTEGAGAVLLSLDRDGRADEDAFVRLLEDWDVGGEDQKRLSELQKSAAHGHTWVKAADAFERAISSLFATYQASTGAVARELMFTSDIYALEYYLGRLGDETVEAHPLLRRTKRELEELYGWRHGRTDFAAMYRDYYEHERDDKGVAYTGEELVGTARYQHLERLLGEADLPAGAVVVDYGCAHGSLTLPLARAFPGLQFVGFDLDAGNVAEGQALAERWELPNVAFYLGDANDATWDEVLDRLGGTASVVLAAEVLEHVERPGQVVDRLAPLLGEDGWFLLTTPSGPWEAQGYRQEHPWRAHVHHLERQDLHDMFGHHPGFQVQLLPDHAWRDRALGHYVTRFDKPRDSSWGVDYDRKLSLLRPRQTLTAAVLVGGEATTLRRMLENVADVADEVVVGLDTATIGERAREELHAFYLWSEEVLWPVVRVVEVPSPLQHGFETARNAILDQATGDWIIWPDSDEWLHHGEEVLKYLRVSCWDGFAVRQQHLSAEPVGLLKTDLPVKLFRNDGRIRFYGLVHEHPEKRLNEGAGRVALLPDAQVIHDGYESETVRRSRFHRNLDLLARDRERYPDRLLGKFLWLRDLAQMNGYELEQTGGQLTHDVHSRAREGVELFGELLEQADARMLRDAAQFYSQLAQTVGGGFWSAVRFDAADDARALEGGEDVQVYFASADHARRLTQRLVDEGVSKHEGRYR